MGSRIPDDYPFCIMLDKQTGEMEWSELHWHQKLCYDEMLTQIKGGNGGGISCSTCAFSMNPIEVITTEVVWQNKKHKYIFRINHNARPFHSRDEIIFDGQISIKLGDMLFHDITHDPRPIPAIKQRGLSRS